MRLVIDTETDGFLRKLSTVHCLVAIDLDTGEIYRYDDSGKYESVAAGLTYVMEADEIWGHNLIGYDLPAIQEIYPFFNAWEGKYRDTLILSRLFFTDMLDRDLRGKPANMPGNLYGRHSLESWGYRLGVLKSEYGKQLHGDWSTYTPQMLEYCVRDVEATVALVKLFQPKLEQYADAIKTEHDCALVMTRQEQAGFPFDIAKARVLESKLRSELETLSDEMRATFTFVAGKEFTPARNNATRGYIEGCPFTKLTEFSPTSRDHIAWAFQTHRGWEPIEMTDTGKPKIDEEVLNSIGTDEAKAFGRILELQKHVGMLSEGKNSWLQMVEADGHIHHSCMLNTATGRNVHLRPNLAQVPSGHEFRELFTANEGELLVSADCSGLELRCLAHYLARFDGGKFGKTLLEGDIHTDLAEIYGTDRKTGKTVTYCLIYGGGNAKLGLSAGEPKRTAAKRGNSIRQAIMRDLDGFGDLITAVQAKAETGVINGLDGRPVRLRKPHAALNYLLQSAGAIICKNWIVRANELAVEAGTRYTPVEFVHDQTSWSVHPDDVEKALFCITSSIKDVEHKFRFRVPLEVDPKSGATWADVH